MSEWKFLPHGRKLKYGGSQVGLLYKVGKMKSGSMRRFLNAAGSTRVKDVLAARLAASSLRGSHSRKGNSCIAPSPAPTIHPTTRITIGCSLAALPGIRAHPSWYQRINP